MRSKELRLVQEHYATVKPDSSVTRAWNENLQRKKNWTVKSTDLKENAAKVKSVFIIRAALWNEKLGRWLGYCRSLKNTLQKLVVAVNLAAIWFEFWTKKASVTVEIFVLCGWRFSYQFDIVLETHFSCNTVAVRWAVVCYTTLLADVPWNGLEHSHWKARLCVSFNWF